MRLLSTTHTLMTHTSLHVQDYMWTTCTCTLYMQVTHIHREGLMTYKINLIYQSW